MRATRKSGTPSADSLPMAQRVGGVLRHGVPARAEHSGDLGPRAPGGIHRPYIIHCVQGHGHLLHPSRPVRQSNRPGKPCGEGRAPGPRGAALLLKLLNFSCSRCSFSSEHSDHFLVNINSASVPRQRRRRAGARRPLVEQQGSSERVIMHPGFSPTHEPLLHAWFGYA